MVVPARRESDGRTGQRSALSRPAFPRSSPATPAGATAVPAGHRHPWTGVFIFDISVNFAMIYLCWERGSQRAGIIAGRITVAATQPPVWQPQCNKRKQL